MRIYVLLNLTRRLPPPHFLGTWRLSSCKSLIACTMKPIWAWGTWVLFAYAILQQQHAPNTGDSTLVAYNPPTLTGVGHQWTASTCTGCNQCLSLAKSTLKVAHDGRNRSLVAHTNKCGWAGRHVKRCQLHLWLLRHIEWEEATPNYKWIGWVWEISGWSSRLPENHRPF